MFASDLGMRLESIAQLEEAPARHRRQSGTEKRYPFTSRPHVILLPYASCGGQKDKQGEKPGIIQGLSGEGTYRYEFIPCLSKRCQLLDGT